MLTRFRWLRRLSIALAPMLVLALAAVPAQALPTNCTQSGTIVTCTYTTVGESMFAIPSGISNVEIIATGASGGNGQAGEVGGVGAVADATSLVQPATTLYVEVGGNGTHRTYRGVAGGYNGGGFGDASGGGASDVRTAAASVGLDPDPRLVVAGGGGGAGNYSTTGPGGPGGDGGAAGAAGGSVNTGTSVGSGTGGQPPSGANGGLPGTGGTHTIAGATDGLPGTQGGLGAGGQGGGSYTFSAGGGGGGGYYGGGGGGGGAHTDGVEGGGGGGGGGSSLALGGTVALAGAGTQPSVVIKYNTAPRSTTTSLACSPATITAGQSTTCTTTVADAPLGTRSTPTGTVKLYRFTGAGTLGAANCPLSPTGTLGVAACSFTYTVGAGEGESTDTLHGVYQPDLAHASSVGNGNVSVKRRSSGTFISCVPGSVTVGVASSCTATVSDTGPGTASTPTGSVAFTSDGSGSFSAASCTLVAKPSGVASCAVSYTPSAVGSGTHGITGTFGSDSAHGGDGAHLGSVGSGSVAVSAPVVRPAAVVGSCRAVGVGSSSATLSAAVDGQGLAVSVRFVYGRTTSYGSVTAPGGASAAVRGLTPGATYHCRAVATSTGGSTTGADGAFSTPKEASGLKVSSFKLSPTAKGCKVSASRARIAAAGRCSQAKLAVAGSITSYANNGVVTVTLTGKVGRKSYRVSGRSQVRRGRWSLSTKLPGAKASAKWSVAVVYPGSGQVQAKTLRGFFRLGVK